MSSKQRQAKNRADRQFSLLVRDGQGYQCENCLRFGQRQQIQCAHWLSRRFAWTRTDERNAFCLCAGCHRRFTDNPTAFSDWAVNRRGRGTYQVLLRRSQLRVRFDWLVEEQRLAAGARVAPAEAGFGEPGEVVFTRYVEGWWTVGMATRRFGPVDVDTFTWVWTDDKRMTRFELEKGTGQ